MKFIATLFGKIQRRIISFYVSLFLPKTNKVAFLQSYHSALSLYKEKKTTYHYDKFLMPEWKQNTISIEKYFEENFSISFLRNQILKRTMFAHLPEKAKAIQKKLINSFFKTEDAKKYLLEDAIGNPILNDIEYLTSGNTIHHLYHLAKFSTELKIDLKEIQSYVELGGGYGNLAKITKKINPDITFTIIDIPIFSFIQYTYLTAIFGKEHVVFFDKNVGIIPKKINLVTLDESIIEEFSRLKYSPDVFLSTWALSESNQATQTFVRNNNYFNAKYLLLAYQKANDSFEFAQEVTKLSDDYLLKYNEETEYLTDNYYLFATKR